MNKMQKLLLQRKTPTYTKYYNGVMSYSLHGKDWSKYVREAFPDLAKQTTSENIFKTVIDLYAEQLYPSHKDLHGIGQTLVPLLIRGEAPIIIDHQGTVHYPEHYEMISDGEYTMAAVFTRSLKEGKDYVTFVDSHGKGELWAQDIPNDLSSPNSEGYSFVEETHGHTLVRLALPDNGFGASLAALQDRINHSIIDQTIVAEMYARPFWYLLNAEIPVTNPYMPESAQTSSPLTKHKTDNAAGRVFTSSSSGPFGQLEPPTIGDMIAYHDSIVDKVSQTTGIPSFYFKPGTGVPPTGIALKTQTRRFMGRVAAMRNSIRHPLMTLCAQMGISDITEPSALWTGGDDLLQDSIDSHGLNLSQMGYPLDYVASVVTPGVDLSKYEDDGFSTFNQVRVGS